VEILRDTAPGQAAGGWYDEDLLYAVVTRRSEAWADIPEGPGWAGVMRETAAVLVDLPRSLKREVDALLSALPHFPNKVMTR